jgi:diaminohydroxyphosphoribosylaminopyrimidine deaminase/5-amino-6-(5-phosphoribosylamino)uracil reductase
MAWPEWRREMMRLAIEEAAGGKGKTYPNPLVGAVVARGKKVLGRGYHRRWGAAHAEVEAMKAAGKNLKGADLYVTLEPCCNFGVTPPCTDAIIASGIGRVFAAGRDPNPAVNGRGFRALRKAGVKVEVGLEARAAAELNPHYFSYMKLGRPFVTLKAAQTLDGRIAMADGDAKWITSAASRVESRRMRAEAQAILVGAETVRNDDPGLLSLPRRSRDYIRCVLDTRLSIPTSSQIVRTAGRFSTLVFCNRPDGAKRMRLERAGVMVREVGLSGRGRLSLDEVLAVLAEMEVMHLFVEGGGRTHTSFLRAGLCDRLVLFLAPKVLGEAGTRVVFRDLGIRKLADAKRFLIEGTHSSGPDLVVTMRPGGR